VRAQELADTPEIDERAAVALRAGVAVSRAFSAGVAGKLTVAFDAVDGAAAEARSVQDPFVEARALMVNGVLWLWEGKAEEARTSLRQALDISWEQRFSFLADRCGRWLVHADVEAGRDDEALELAAPLLARADERGDPSVAVGVRAALAELWRQRGDLDQACSLATAAVELARERSVAVDAEAEAYLTLARADLDRSGTAEAPLKELRALLERDAWLGWRLDARFELVCARAALASGDFEEAKNRAVQGRLRLDRAAAIRERIEADLIEGQALVASGDAAGLTLIDKALTDAEVFGSPYVVERVAKALAAAAGALHTDEAAGAQARADVVLSSRVEAR
jgi:hypothetical protein